MPVTCLGPVGQTCVGNVLILTVDRYRPVRGGPSGQLRVMFAHISIPGGATQAVSGPVSSEVARLLRRRAPLKVDVSASLSWSGKPSTSYSAIRTLRVRS